MSYNNLTNLFRRLGQLEEVAAIVEWDRAVNMPDAASGARAEAVAALAVTRHELLTQPKVAEWLAETDSSALDLWSRANLTAMRRLAVRAQAVPGDLIEARSRASATCEQAWRQLRRDNDFPTFAPLLREVLALTRESADALGQALGCSPYDALIDEYEPGASSQQIDQVQCQ